MVRIETLGDVVDSVLKTYGENKALDSEFVLSVFDSNTESIPEERKLLEAFLKCDGVALVLSTKNFSDEMKRGCIITLSQDMQDKYWVDLNGAQSLCWEVYYRITGNKLEAPQSPQTTKLPKNTRKSSKPKKKWFCLIAGFFVLFFVIKGCFGGDSVFSRNKGVADIVNPLILRDNPGKTINLTTSTEQIVYTTELITTQKYSGYIGDESQKDDHFFTAPIDGVYGIEGITDTSGFEIRYHIGSSYDENITYGFGGTKGGSIYLTMSAGETYRIRVISNREIGGYEIKVHQPKPEYEIRNTDVVIDSCEFEGQENTYLFTPVNSGVHRFWFSNINAGLSFSIYLYDSLGERITYFTMATNGYGLTPSLIAGENYTIVVKQCDGFGSYNLNIGKPSSVSDITGCSIVVDQTTFEGQVNHYTYVPLVTGNHEFSIDQINNGVEVSVLIYDSGEYCIAQAENIGRGEGTEAELRTNETYSIYVVQASDFGEYTLSISAPRETVDITGYDGISESIEFEDQINSYYFTPFVTGEYTFYMAALDTSHVAFYIIDDAGYNVEWKNQTEEGDEVVAELEANRTYTIQVKYRGGLGSYTFTIVGSEE